jgi:GntR family transcriptional regulator
VPAGDTTSMPLHRRLESLFRRAIAEGSWPEGTRIPTEHELVRQYGVSRHTVRQALGSLVQDGLIDRRAGDGSYVSSAASADPLAPWMSFSAMLRRRGLRARVEMVAHDEVAAGDRAELLGLRADDLVQRLVRVHRYGDRPLAAEIVHLPARLVGRLRSDDVRGSLYGVLERRGLLPVRACLEVRRATPSELEGVLRPYLRNGPLVRLERVSFLASGQPVEHLVFWYPHNLELWLLGDTHGGEEEP